MKLKIFFFNCICILPFFLYAQKDTVVEQKNLKWFENTNCDVLEIKDYKTIVSKKPQKTKIITDKKTISNLIALIEKIPTNGQEMKSFGDEVAVVTLEFGCTNEKLEIKKQEVEFYRGRAKTPSTGFLEERSEFETKAFEMVQYLLKEK